MAKKRAMTGSYDDLDVFKRAYALSIVLHRASLSFPKIEQYGGLADQLRRSSKSVAALIAEGLASNAGRRSSFVASS